MGRSSARSLATLVTVLCAAVLGTACGATEADVNARSAAPSMMVSAPARIVSTEQLDARTVDLTIDSPALGTVAKVRLLTPLSSSPPASGWPVLYLLQGCCDNYQSWTRNTDVEQLTADAGVLVAMPDGGRVGFYSNWLDGPAWETFHLTELPRLLAESYGAGGRRAIAGLSMGGFGALSYAARNPNMFAAAASFSGIVHTRLNSQSYLSLLRTQGADPAALWGDLVEDAKTWADHNPYDLAANLRGTPLYLSVGDGHVGPLDPPGSNSDSLEAQLNAENVALRARLKTLGVDATSDFYGPGTHTWPYWERALHRAWPMLQEALARG